MAHERVADCDIEVPHLEIPLRFRPCARSGLPRLGLVEQDTPEEIGQCVDTIVRYPTDFRPELPEFGIPDQALAEGGADVDDIIERVLTWEPRADVVGDQELEDMVSRVNIESRARSDG